MDFAKTIEDSVHAYDEVYNYYYGQEPAAFRELMDLESERLYLVHDDSTTTAGQPSTIRGAVAAALPGPLPRKSSWFRFFGFRRWLAPAGSYR